MKGDFSRLPTTDSAAETTGVWIQQGVPLSDQDLNAREARQARAHRELVSELVGNHGTQAPAVGAPLAFQVRVDTGRPVLGAGRYYAQGLAVHNIEDGLDLAALVPGGLPEADGQWLVWLDAWEREETPLDSTWASGDPALGGVVTAIRSRCAWTVRFEHVETGEAWATAWQRVGTWAAATPTCAWTTAGGLLPTHRGLLRLEVHQPGVVATAAQLANPMASLRGQPMVVSTEPELVLHPTPPDWPWADGQQVGLFDNGGFQGVATVNTTKDHTTLQTLEGEPFCPPVGTWVVPQPMVVWSRDNGAVLLRARVSADGAAVLVHTGRHSPPVPGDLIELLDADHTRQGFAGPLRAITHVASRPGEADLTLAKPLDTAAPVSVDEDGDAWVRIWHGCALGDGQLNVDLGDHLHAAVSPGVLRSGDAWTLALRPELGRLPVAPGVPQATTAGRHHAAPLAVIEHNAIDGWKVVEDTRRTFSPLTREVHNAATPGTVDIPGDAGVRGTLTVGQPPGQLRVLAREHGFEHVPVSPEGDPARMVEIVPDLVVHRPNDGRKDHVALYVAGDVDRLDPSATSTAAAMLFVGTNEGFGTGLVSRGNAPPLQGEFVGEVGRNVLFRRHWTGDLRLPPEDHAVLDFGTASSDVRFHGRVTVGDPDAGGTRRFVRDHLGDPNTAVPVQKGDAPTTAPVPIAPDLHIHTPWPGPSLVSAYVTGDASLDGTSTHAAMLFVGPCEGFGGGIVAHGPSGGDVVGDAGRVTLFRRHWDLDPSHAPVDQPVVSWDYQSSDVRMHGGAQVDGALSAPSMSVPGAVTAGSLVVHGNVDVEGGVTVGGKPLADWLAKPPTPARSSPASSAAGCPRRTTTSATPSPTGSRPPTTSWRQPTWATR